jgi:hypothetical protein
MIRDQDQDRDRSGASDLALTLVAVVAILLMIPVVDLAGHMDPWALFLILAAAVMVISRRDSLRATFALGAMGVIWLGDGPATLSAWTLVVAVLLFTAHTSLAMGSCSPPAGSLGRAVVLRWLGRWAVVVVITAAVFGLARLIQNLHKSDAEIIVALAFVVLVGLVLLLRNETLVAVKGEETNP